MREQSVVPLKYCEERFGAVLPFMAQDYVASLSVCVNKSEGSSSAKSLGNGLKNIFFSKQYFIQPECKGVLIQTGTVRGCGSASRKQWCVLVSRKPEV